MYKLCVIISTLMKGVIDMDFAENLKTLRKYRELTQTKLAHKANVSVNSVINYENGRRKSPTISVMMKLAKALDVPPEMLTARRVFVQDDTLFAEDENMSGVLAMGKDGPPSDDAIEKYLESEEQINFSYTVEYAHDRVKFFLECLNEAGLKEAVKRVQELTEIRKYSLLEEGGTCRENEPQTDPERSPVSDQTEGGRLNTAPEETREPES